MYCSICGTEIDSIDKAIDEGWIPSFYEGDTEHEFTCSACSESLLQVGDDGEMEVKPEYRGKIVYANTEKEGHHFVMGIAFRSNAHNN